MGDIRTKATQQRQQQGYDARTEGNTNSSGVDREAARAGSARTPDDIPTQDAIKGGRFVPGNVNVATFIPSTDFTRGRYRMLPAQCPQNRI